MITVVIPTCDRPDELAAALTALTAQRRAPAAVLVVDNGRYPAPLPPSPLPLRRLQAPHRCGAAQARNIGAASAETPWVAFLDDDDRWCPAYLERLEAAIVAAPAVTARYARLELLDAAGQCRSVRRFDPEQPRRLLSRGAGAGGSNIAVARAAWARVGGFDPRLPSCEDRAFAWALCRAGESIAFDADRITYACSRAGPRLSAGRTWWVGQWRFWWLHACEMRPRDHLLNAAALLYTQWCRRFPGRYRDEGAR